MKQKGFKAKHPLAYKMLVATGFVATAAASALVIPKVVDKLSSRMIRSSASVDIPDEGPKIVKNTSMEEREEA